MVTVSGDRQAELALLAACLESKPARDEARRTITGPDFADQAHEHVWDAMTRLDRHGKAVDLATVGATLPPGSTAQRAAVDLVGVVGIPDHVGEYAAIVRSWAIKRQLEAEARRVLQQALNPDANAVGYAAAVVTRFTAIRDRGNLDDDLTAVTVGELLANPDDDPEWLIPDLLERRDRFVLTGFEGLGKSHMLRQFAICAGAGLHPFDPGCTFAPLRTLVVDCENTWRQVKRKIRPCAEWCHRRYGRDVSEQMMVDCTARMDITRDRDLARIHQLLDAWQPDLVVIGPLYRLVPRALQTDDDAAPVLAALDTIRDRGSALLIEAHAGHAIGRGGARDLRPRGSSAFLGWPEFGYGMAPIGTAGYADLIQWRGPREERDWPDRLVRADGFRWMPHTGQHTYESEGASA